MRPGALDVQAMVLLDIADDIFDAYPLQANALRNMARSNLHIDFDFPTNNQKADDQ